MCERLSGRDERGRFRGGVSGNPKGRPPRGPMARLARLLAEAERCGARITINVVPAPANDVPPEAA